MKNLFAFKNSVYVGRVIESEMGTLDGYPQKFVTVLLRNGAVETKKDTSWTYAGAEEVVAVLPGTLEYLRDTLDNIRRDPSCTNGMNTEVNNAFHLLGIA